MSEKHCPINFRKWAEKYALYVAALIRGVRIPSAWDETNITYIYKEREE